jgi:CBS domain containing-hemolysin-like protein
MAADDAAALLRTRWDTDATTVGGLVTAALGRLPAPGDRTVVGAYEFEVERVADRALVSALARRVVPEQTGADE